MIIPVKRNNKPAPRESTLAILAEHGYRVANRLNGSKVDFVARGDGRSIAFTVFPTRDGMFRDLETGFVYRSLEWAIRMSKADNKS